MTAISSSARGFTLLEVLIAMSILGIMLSLLFGSFAICSRSWNTGENHIHKVEQMAMVQNFFRTCLSTAWNEGSSQQGELAEEEETISKAEREKAEARAFFLGREQYLQFVALLPESAALGGWYQFRIGVDTKSGALNVAMAPFLPGDEESPAAAQTLEIIPDVEKLVLAYWGKSEEEDKPQWHKEWVNKPNLPELISINMQLRNQSAWPTVVVAPRRAPPSTSGEQIY